MAWRNEYDEKVRDLLYQMGAIDIGNIYWVMQSSKSFYGTFLSSHLFTYPDGSRSVYADAGTGDGIAAAIAVCKGGRNDYVIVGTGAYNLTAALTLAGKSSVHLWGVGALYDVGCAQGTVLIQTGNYQNVIMETAGELAGLHIINKTGYQAVTGAITVYGGRIHHNNFRIVGGAAIDLVSLLLFSGGSIDRNRFYTYTGGVLNSVLYVGEGTGVDVCKNYITASAQAVYTNGIYCDAVSGLVADNYLGEGGGTAAGAYGGQIVNGIRVPYHGNVINNRCALATGEGLNGGTANISFVDNRDGQAGGATPITT